MTFSIAAEGLRKTYRSGSGEMHALDGVDLIVREGERVGIIGENGAGKSTLLRIVAGLSQPSAGKLEVAGHVQAVLTLGVGLHEELSGRENLRLDAEIQGVRPEQIRGRVEAMTEFADLGPFIDQPVRTYSSGMKSRLAFAGLVHIDPEILLIDEALSTGDHAFQRKASQAIRALCARGRIVIVVSHSLSAIVELCSRCLWLRQGRIVADGDPAEVTAAYAAHMRRREEERLAADFAGKHQDWQADGAARISALRIEGADGSRRHLFRPDEPATAIIEIDLARGLAPPYLRLVVERMDGLLVSENAAPAEILSSEAAGRHEVRAALPRILLGPGLYQMDVELGEGGRPLARRSVPFKVDTDVPVIGGRPVLLAPMDVTVARVGP